MAGSLVLGGEEAAGFPFKDPYEKIMDTAAAKNALRATPRELEITFIFGQGETRGQETRFPPEGR